MSCTVRRDENTRRNGHMSPALCSCASSCIEAEEKIGDWNVPVLFVLPEMAIEHRSRPHLMYM